MVERGQGEVENDWERSREVGGEISPWRLAARDASPRGEGTPRPLQTASMT